MNMQTDELGRTIIMTNHIVSMSVIDGETVVTITPNKPAVRSDSFGEKFMAAVSNLFKNIDPELFKQQKTFASVSSRQMTEEEKTLNPEIVFEKENEVKTPDIAVTEDLKQPSSETVDEHQEIKQPPINPVDKPIAKKEVKPIIDWDNPEGFESTAIVVNPTILEKAKASIENLDTSEAEKEFKEKEAAIKHIEELKKAGLAKDGSSDEPLLNPSARYTQTELAAMSERRIQKAKQAVDKMIEDYERGDRVGVDDKQLLNCRADLNQLVPFKYPEPWSLYLTSCESHWMPAEQGIEKAVQDLEQIARGTPRKFIARYYFNYLQRMKAFPPEVLLNIYRLITNPECRQYLLRQGFEAATINHALADLNESFDPTRITMTAKDANGSPYPIYISKAQWEIDGWTFKNRYKLAVELTSFIQDLTTVTEGPENTSKFIESMVYTYGYVNWIKQIVVSYQLIHSNKIEGSMQNLTNMVIKLLKDIQSQTYFAKFFISNALAENPHVLTDEFKTRVINNFTRVKDAEFDLVSTLINTDEESSDLTNLLDYYIYDFLSGIGLSGLTSVQLNPGNMWFVELINSLQPHVSKDAGLSGNGGKLEF